MNIKASRKFGVAKPMKPTKVQKMSIKEYLRIAERMPMLKPMVQLNSKDSTVMSTVIGKRLLKRVHTGWFHDREWPISPRANFVTHCQ